VDTHDRQRHCCFHCCCCCPCCCCCQVCDDMVEDMVERTRRYGEELVRLCMAYTRLMACNSSLHAHECVMRC
jgi:hypothetical protein